MCGVHICKLEQVLWRSYLPLSLSTFLKIVSLINLSLTELTWLELAVSASLDDWQPSNPHISLSSLPSRLGILETLATVHSFCAGAGNPIQIFMLVHQISSLPKEPSSVPNFFFSSFIIILFCMLIWEFEGEGFETVSHHIALAPLEVGIKTRLAFT